MYQPVLDAIAAREQKIAIELADAASHQAEAKHQQDAFRQKHQAFDAERAGLLQQATDAARAEGKRLQALALAAAAAARAARDKALLAEARQVRDDITRHAQDQVFAIASRVLADLAAVSLEQRMCAVFIQRLKATEGHTLAQWGVALKAATDARPALLRSAFALPPAQRSDIQAALQEAFGQPIALAFETTPELVSGIELSAQGQKLAWSIADYLDGLASGLPERLGQRASG